MLEPTGPLPPEIYWRRRAVALGGVVVVVALIVWLISAIRGGGDSPEPDPVAVGTSSTVSISPTTSGSSSGSSGSAGSSGGGGAAAADYGGSSGTSGTSSSPGSSSGSVSSSAQVSGQQAAAGQCSDQSLAIKVNTDKPTYQAGEEPSFTTVITNIGTTPCTRDLGSSLQQVLVYTIDGNQRLWSNIDCFPQSAADIRTLAPGEQAGFTVKWSAKTSTPDCLTQPQPQRNQVGPGAYTVIGQLGQLRSAPEPFNLA